MNLRRVNAIARKEFIQLWRDPRSMGLALAIPALLIFLFGYALNLDVDNVPIVIWDQDNSQISKDFILNFHNSRYFNVMGYYDNYKDMIHLLDKSIALMSMVIPKDFSKFIQSQNTAPVQIIIDGSDSNTARIAMGYAETIVANYNQRLVTKAFSGQVTMDPITTDFRPRSWFNPNRESRDFIIPGNIAVIIMIIAALLTSLTVAREWERGSMEQLISTPVRGPELITGKFAPYFVIGYIDLAIAVSMGVFLFRVAFNGSAILLFFLSGIFIAGALALGIFISIFAKDQRLASQIAILGTFMPTYLLSGFVFAIFNMPKIIRIVTYTIPAKYYLIILRGIFAKGIGLKYLMPSTIFLIGFAAIMIALANMRFKKKVVEGRV